MRIKNRRRPKALEAHVLDEGWGRFLCFVEGENDGQDDAGGGDPPDKPPEDPEAGEDGKETPPDDPPKEETPPDDGLTDEERAVPESEDGYDLTIDPETGFKDADGNPFQFDPNDPFAKEARAALHKFGAPTGLAKQLISVFAKAQVADAKTMQDMLTADGDKFRTEQMTLLNKTDPKKGQERADAAVAGLSAIIGESHAKALSKDLRHAESILAIEAILEKANATGGAWNGDNNGGDDGLTPGQRFYRKK